MSVAIAGNVVGFTGTLVQRQQAPGKNYIQLIFSTAEGARLSISRNFRMARSLEVGHEYKVEGTEYSLGEKTYIGEPIAKPLSSTRGFLKNRSKIIIFAAIILCTGVGAAAFFVTQTESSQSAPQSKQTTAATTPKKTDTLGASTQTAQTTTAAPTVPAAPAATTKTTTKKSTPKPATKAVATPAVLQPAASQSSAPAGSNPDTAQSPVDTPPSQADEIKADTPPDTSTTP
jgi:cytoskeletal protein RodZ